MIEALNIGAVTTSAAGAGARQAVFARREQLQLEKPSAPVAPYVSPRVRVDNLTNVALIEIRDGETGDVVDSFPSEKQILAFKKADSLGESAPEAQAAPAPVEPAKAEAASVASVAVDTGGVSPAQETTSIVA